MAETQQSNTRTELQSAFRTADKDGNGLDKQELSELLIGLGFRENNCKGLVEVLFKQLDDDRSGLISMEEFQKVLVENNDSFQIALLRKVFDEINKDDDKYLSDKEISKALTDEGFTLTMDQMMKLANLFSARFRREKEKTVTFDEFASVLGFKND